MTQWALSGLPVVIFVILISAAVAVYGQSDEFRVYTESPRLLLTRARLRLVQRERERQSMRWQQFDALVSGGAPMPEPGFAFALYYRASGNVSWSRQAVEWALTNAAQDLRQLALVYDWCEMTGAQRDQLGAKIERSLTGANAMAGSDLAAQTARALAAIALADRLPDQGEAILKPIIEQWWRSDLAKRLESGQTVIPRDRTYALYELLHTIRDNLKIDLREAAPGYFKLLPTDHLVSHYPTPYHAAENEYRVPTYVRDGEPNLEDAMRSRAAELAMVAYDPNAAEIQFLQGWLMQDRFQLRSALGSPYEFLWANPYQPGLSYFQMPLVFHNAANGRLFARTSWDEDATWIGYFDGNLQLFRDGEVQTLKSGAVAEPMRVGGTVVMSAASRDQTRFRANAEGIFVLGLTPRTMYEIEVDDQELTEDETDTGGTLVLSLPEGIDAGVRLKRRE